VRKEAGNKARASSASARSLLRSVGRVAIWIVVGLLLIRGLGAVLAPTHTASTSAAVVGRSNDQASAAFAVRFARTFLADPSPQALAPFLAEGARVGGGWPGRDAPEPAQAEVSRVEELGGGREVLTVACELRDARTLYLAVPIVRSSAGEVAALGAPSIVAAPGVAGAGSERPRPLAGPEAARVRALVAKFVPAYLGASEASDLAYLLAPGASVVPLGGSLRLLSLSRVSQLGAGEGSRRTVLATVRVGDRASGATYPLAYRLVVVEHGRWYVQAVEGGLA
jgi:Conjugative transposon protein TcpC